MLAGIDPGAQGAIAWLSDDGHLIAVDDLPVMQVKGRTRLIPAVLAGMLRDRRPHTLWLEEVGTRPGEGAVGAFSFGRGFGQLEGIAAALAIRTEYVRPATWKKSLRIPADKTAARLRASQLWPGAAEQFKRVRDDGRAEACLIALYGANASHGEAPGMRMAVPAPRLINPAT